MPLPRATNYLRALRKRNGITQREVAFLIGVKDDGCVSRFERGRRAPPLEALLAYESLFGVPVAELFAHPYENEHQSVCLRREALVARLRGASGARPSAIKNRKVAFLLRGANNHAKQVDAIP